MAVTVMGVSQGASGGVSVRAGPSPSLKSRRVRARRERAREQTEDERVRATGALLCSECGRLEWPEPVSASPHRMTEEVERRPACPHCESQAWIDLRRESTALAIRLGEEGIASGESALVDTMRKAGLGVIVGSFVGILATSSLLVGGLVAGLAGVAGGLASVRLRKMSAAPTPVLPDRWSMALPPSQPPTEVVRGVPECAAVLHSPLTGRPCVAYEIGLREDDDGQGELATWALLEQRVASMRIGERDVDPQVTFADVPRESLGELSPQLLDAAALEWLAERGYSAVGSSLRVFESIVPPDTEVVFSRGEAGAVLSRASNLPAVREP